MKNPITSYIDRRVEKLLSMQTTPDNQVFQQMFDQLTAGINILQPESDPREYITKGYLYNDLIYSIITLKYDMVLPIEWYAYEVVDEKAYQGFLHHTKAYKSGINALHNYKQAKTYREKALKEVPDNDPVAKLIAKPNNYKSFNEIVAESFIWLDINGNFYLYGLERETGLKEIISLHVPPAHEVEIVAGTTFDPIAGYKLKSYFKHQDSIEPQKIMHLKTFNPDFNINGSHLYGVSPLKAGRRILNLDNTGIDTSTANFANGGVRAIIHQAISKDSGYTNQLDPAQIEQLKKKIESWTGADKSGSMVATNQPVAITKIGDTPVDLGVYTAMQTNMVRLCNLLSVPPELYQSGTTFSNKAEARKKMITAGILPRLDLFKKRFNTWAVERYNNGRKRYHVDYDLFSITELQDDLSKIAEMYAKTDWVTINEKREAMNFGRMDEEKDPTGRADSIMVDPFTVPLAGVGFQDGYDEIDTEMKNLNIRAYD